MGRRSNLSETTKAQIWAMRQADVPVIDVMRVLDVSQTSVARHGGRAPGSGMPRGRVDISLIRELRAFGYTVERVAQILGCHPNTVQRHAPGHVGKVPVAPLREAFQRSPMTAADVARELGWWSGARADTGRLRRTLGLLPDLNGHGSPPKRRTLADAETVRLIAEAIGVSPWSVLPDDDRPAWATEQEAA